MSWDGYIDNIIAHGKGEISKAVIIGLDGSIWTPPSGDKHINVTAAEAATIGATMKSKSAANFQANGILLHGVKYMFLRDLDGDGKIMTGKKGGLGNIVIQSTTQAVLIAFTPDGKSAGTSNAAVDTVAKYLEGTGY